MAAADEEKDLRADELTAMVRAIRDRVRESHPSGEAGGARIPLPDLMLLHHARDAAEGKVAAIGTVNPRPGGPVNAVIQSVKRFIARAMDWHVREQVEYNRALLECVNAAIEALNESNRAIARLDRQAKAFEDEVRDLNLNDLRTHWETWRVGWEQKLTSTEIRFLRTIAELRGAFDQRVMQLDGNLRASSGAAHKQFTDALEKAALAMESQVRTDFGRIRQELDQIRSEHERMIHNELRVVRQRAAAQPQPAAAVAPVPAGPPASVPELDYLSFSARFRGSEEYVKRNNEFYVERFQGCEQVLDLGCGRGEFLEAMRSSGIPARGVDLDEESVNLCRSKGLGAEAGDMFRYLGELDDASLDGIFCSQVIEHLRPAQLPELVSLAASRLRRGGLVAFETPNPECLAIFATHFYIDPTHNRPVPASLMVFYLEEAGFGGVEVTRLSPAVESMPSLASLPADFREAFFGGLDYAVIARRL